MSLPAPEPSTTVVITGASSGIGTELARQLAERGYNLVLVARRRERLEELAGMLRARHGIAVDLDDAPVGDPDARARLIDSLHEGEREVVGLCTTRASAPTGASRGSTSSASRRRCASTSMPSTTSPAPSCPACSSAAPGRSSTSPRSRASSPSRSRRPTRRPRRSCSPSGRRCTPTCSAPASHAPPCPGPTKTEFVAVAEMQGLESNAPGFLWQSADAVAREGIEGMVHGRRTVIPGATNKVTAQAGRLTPRSVLLPVMRAIYGRS